MPFGLASLLLVFTSILAPPVYVCSLFVEGQGPAAFAVLVGWLLWLRFGLRLLRWMLQRGEYSSL
jgi:hypothetical protein